MKALRKPRDLMADTPMLKFVAIGRDMPDKRSADVRRADFHEIYAEYAAAKAREQARKVQPMRSALLPDPLSAAQQHSGLAEAHCSRAPSGSVRDQLGDERLPRDLRADLPPGPAVRRQLRD